MHKEIRFQSRNAQIYAHLRSMIIQGKLEPNSKLVIDHLAEDLGVSHIPVREAIFQLEADGFVETKAYVGASVTDIKPESIQELFALLEALELISVKAACQNLSNEALEELERLVKQMAKHLDDPDTWSAENKRFHGLICEQAGTRFIKKMLDTALDHWDRLRHIFLKEVFKKRIRLAQEEHQGILEALRERNEARLEQVIKNHNQKSLAAYMLYLESSGALKKEKPCP